MVTGSRRMLLACQSSGEFCQRWWDPAWRAEKLKQIQSEGPKEEVLDENEWWDRLEKLKVATDQQEVVIKRNFGRSGAEILEDFANRLGLHFHAYKKGRNTVLLVSQVPLPNYRAGLDDHHGSSQHQISSATTETRVENMLANIRGADAPLSSLSEDRATQSR